MLRARPVTAVLVAALALGAAPAASEGQTPAPAPAPVLVVGDSLAVGMRPALGQMLPDRHLTWSVRSGITTPQGMDRLRGALRYVQPQTVVISLGTNDGPDGPRFADRIRRTMARIAPDTCVVWAAVNRVSRKGRFRALNRALRAAAARDHRLTVIGWDHMVARGTVVLPDGIHPDAAGFQRRAHRYAVEVQRGCGG